MGAHLYHLNFIWKNFEQNPRTFFSTIHHHHHPPPPPSTVRHNKLALRPGTPRLTSDGYILEEPNKFSQKAWVLYAWVLITLNWEAFFSVVFPSFPLSALYETGCCMCSTWQLEDFRHFNSDFAPILSGDLSCVRDILNISNTPY